jgi:hypothetical protein
MTAITEPIEITETTEITGTTDDIPAVRLQPCVAFHFDADADWPACGDCGWLEDEHARPTTAGAVITDLPRLRVQVPERLAS